MMFEIIMQANGWNEGWKTVFGLVGNSTSIPASASQAAKDTSIGQTAVSLAIDSYALAQIEQNGSNNMTFILPEGQTVINPDCAGILKGAPNRKTAEIFLEFLLSEECQKVWMLQKGKPGGPRESSLNRLSILPSLYRGNEDSVPVNPYSLKSALSFDFNLASSRWALLNDLIGVFAIDCADLVRKSYRRVLDGKCPERIFCELPIAEADQKTLIDRWKDQVFRNKQLNAFLKFSVRKFKTCLKQ
jgi:spermidine/putrescine-binding protein